MPLPIHLTIHLFFSLLAGILAYRFWKKPEAAIAGGVLGGFLVDLDHHIDYFFAFGADFNWKYFIRGYQFLKSDHVYIYFHGWEYVVIFFLIVLAVRHKTTKTFFYALALALFFHLASDVFLNGLSPEFYSISWRASKGFEERNMASPENHQKHLRQKAELEF
jgi:hypothetical protein